MHEKEKNLKLPATTSIIPTNNTTPTKNKERHHRSPSSHHKSKNNTWIFTLEELKDTPSFRDGLSFETERQERLKSCDIIYRIGTFVKA
jgi:hypothetical protein